VSAAVIAPAASMTRYDLFFWLSLAWFLLLCTAAAWMLLQ
jgi:hypothetical protein